MLLGVPHDIQSFIFSFLSLEEISRIRQTCSTLNNSVSTDKQLWLHFFYRDIKARSFPSPRFIRPLDTSTAQDVIEWVKNGITLNKSYLTGYNETLVTSDLSLHVTWIKIVRGRWLLIACSNLQLSKLILWDLHDTQIGLCKATFHFSGPVIEALYEDDGSEILIAFTVGRKVLETVLCSLFVRDNEVYLRRVHEFTGFAFARFIKRPYIGFAVRNGDDTCPHVFNWESGSVKTLVPAESVFNLIDNEETPGWVGHEPCTGLFMWKGHIFALYPYQIVVYEDDLPFDQPGDCLLTHVACEQLDTDELWAYASATIVNDETQVQQSIQENDLHLVMRSGEGRIFAYKIHYQRATDPSKRFTFRNTGYFRLCETIGSMLKATKLSIGPSCGQLVVHALDQVAWHESLLCTAPIIKKYGSSEVDFGMPVVLDMKGLPLLFEMTSMDFDDGLGILVFAMRSGQIFVRTFGSKATLTCLKNELPTSDSSSDFCERVPLDLPLSYRLPENSYEEAFREEIMEITRTWQDESSAPQIPGWSSDWSKFDNVLQWIMPYPRWGLLDTFYKRKTITCARIRLRLGALADIIPVMYDEANHFRLVFRIGNRLYYCKSRQPVVDDNLRSDYDFDELPYADILGLLPISYSQFLVSDIQTFKGAVADYWIQRNVDTSITAETDKDYLDRIWMYTTVKDALIEYCGKYPGDEILKTWTKEEWNDMRRASVGLEGSSIPSNCRIESTPDVLNKY